MRSFRVFYDDCLRRQPLLTKMVTSSVFFGSGDRLAQRYAKIGKTDEELSEINKDSIVEEGQIVSKSTAKTVRMMIWGGLFLSPLMHNWYNLLEHVFPGRGAVVALKKVVAEMICLAPQTPIWFFTITGTLSGKTFPQALDTAVEKQPTVLRANYMVWPAANFISHSYVPLQYRVLWSNIVNLGWASFLSTMSNTPTASATTTTTTVMTTSLPSLAMISIPEAPVAQV